jgi:hypothetical protein
MHEWIYVGITSYALEQSLVKSITAEWNNILITSYALEQALVKSITMEWNNILPYKARHVP